MKEVEPVKKIHIVAFVLLGLFIKILFAVIT